MTGADDHRLTEIRARLDAIIPGPWRWFGNTATDQVYLGTIDRGRLIILSPSLRTEETVFDHDACTGYTLAQARERIPELCGAHDDDAATGLSCRCEELRDFLAGELERGEGDRDLVGRDSRYVVLTRHLHTHADMQLAAPEPRPSPERSRFGATRLASYREFVRYEVLGLLEHGYFRHYRTRTENPSGELYREDFMSIATPEAEFIEHAPEDVGYLLDRVRRLEAELEALTPTREEN